MRLVVAGLAALALIAAAGCGDDGDGGPAPPTETRQRAASPPTAEADAFIACFEQPGYHAERPAQGQESGFAAQAAGKGYATVPVNVAQDGNEISASAFLVFFEDATKATQALRDFGFAESEAVKPTTKDNVVVGYLAESDKTTLEASIVGCL